MVSKKFLWTVFVLFVLVNILLLGFLIQRKSTEKTASLKVDYVQASTFRSFGELSDYFTDLAQKKSAAYAFEVLKKVEAPPDLDMHLLAHTVGDILYQQEGLEGIKICTEDFRNACSHSIVIGLFFEQGEAVLPQIAQACYQAPGGSGAYTMCFHGLGHGMLAYASYNLEKAVELCTKTGTAKFDYQESSQCISGTIMEIISGGAHDRELWAKQRPKYFLQDDPLYPCSADFIPEQARYLCYLYLTPHLFEAAGANTWTPTTEAFPFCDNIPVSEPGNRDACYGGFGKEFIGFVAGRDVRAFAIENMTENQLGEVYKFCLRAGNKDGTSSCVRHATNSLYWGGENDRGAAIRFCTIISDSYYQKACFTNLIGAVGYYIKDPAYKKEFCKEVLDSYREECRYQLLQIP